VNDINFNFPLDCGSPDWCPEPPSSENGVENKFPWEEYCDNLKECVMLSTIRYVVRVQTFTVFRTALSADLVLLSHGDIPHSRLYHYAYSQWGLKAPAYSTLPVQAMARIAATEEADGIRDEEDVGGAEEQAVPSNEGDNGTI
jgi:cleavage and polyadenylation specificity factor subunit 2